MSELPRRTWLPDVKRPAMMIKNQKSKMETQQVNKSRKIEDKTGKQQKEEKPEETEKEVWYTFGSHIVTWICNGTPVHPQPL